MVGYTASTANRLSFPADAHPRQAVGSVYGLASMGSGFGGMLFALLTGWRVDNPVYTPVFVVFGITPLIWVAVLWSMLGPLQQRALPGPREGPVHRR